MPDVMRKLNKPHYAFRPQQVLRRFGATSPVRLPWGLELDYDPSGVVGGSLARLGVYDLVVSEVLWRLIGPGDHVLDAGANIGYMTSIMAHRVGPGGCVDAIEAHPVTFRRLEHNAALWNAPVRLHNVALTDVSGEVELFAVTDGDRNQVRASLHRPADAGEPIAVRAGTLDEIVDDPVRVMKLDIEGSELAALRGSPRTLGDVVHIVYEDHEPQPSAVTELLRAAGFEIFVLEERFWGPHADPDLLRARRLSYDAPSLLATRAIDEVHKRLAPRGWRCLRGGSSRSSR